MYKNTLSTGQPVFTQLLKLIPDSLLDELCLEHKTDRYCKRFKGKDHVITMLYATFQKCNSLQEVITGLQANGSRISHFGLKHTPRKSTFAEANIRTNEGFFSDLYHSLQKHYYKSLPDSRSASGHRKVGPDDFYIIDSTTITLFSDVMRGAGSFNLSGKKKGGVKAHTIIDSKHDIPCFVNLTEGMVSDHKFLKVVDFLPEGSTVIVDKGYNSYQKYLEWTSKGITWVTRLNKRAVFKTVDQHTLRDESKLVGIIKDYTIELGNPETAYRVPIQRARLVELYDQKKKKTITFLSNDLTSSPETIADRYKKRWQIEILFKRIKSNFTLKYFLGETPNAIKIQIWSVLIADLLVKIIQDKIRKMQHKKWAFANLASLIRLHLSTYINLTEFLLNPNKALVHYEPPDQTDQTRLF